MEKFVCQTGIAAPWLRQNVDTDVIIRIEALMRYRPDELEPYAFQAVRFLPDGSENPDFVLNQEPYRGASIMICGRNFGCGSSREGAVWAMACMGIRCVIAPSFGAIFYNNCFQNGVLPVVLEAEQVAALAGEADGARFKVDLERQVVTTPSGIDIAFDVPELKRAALLQGLDSIGMTMSRDDAIASFQAKDKLARPWVYY